MACNITAYLTNNSSSRNDVNPFRSPKNSRVGSAIRSVSQMTNRVSLQDFSTKMKARKIQLYRNVDAFFKGVTMAITQERFRTFNSLLSEVNKSAICDSSILQKEVRHIFSLQGEPIYDLAQLKDGQSYVCWSTPVLKSLKFESINSFNWYTSRRTVTTRSYERLDVGERPQMPDYAISQPEMVVVIQAGPRPRNMVRMLLNRRTATSFDQVLTHLASALNLKTGAIREMYMMTGPQVQVLSGFLLDNMVLESEKLSVEGREMSAEEVKFVEPACANSHTAATETATPITAIRKTDQSHSSKATSITAIRKTDQSHSSKATPITAIGKTDQSHSSRPLWSAVGQPGIHIGTRSQFLTCSESLCHLEEPDHQRTGRDFIRETITLCFTHLAISSLLNQGLQDLRSSKQRSPPQMKVLS